MLDEELKDRVLSALEQDPQVANPQGRGDSGRGRHRHAARHRPQFQAAPRCPRSGQERPHASTWWTSSRSSGSETNGQRRAPRGTALQVLISDEEVPDDAIDVRVKDGWITLKGEVRHEFESDAEFDDVTRLEGVGGITNEIRVVTA